MTAITNTGALSITALTQVGSGQSRWVVANSAPRVTTGGTGTDAGALTQAGAVLLAVPLNATRLQMRYAATGTVATTGPTVSVWGFDRLNSQKQIPGDAEAELLTSGVVLSPTTVLTSPSDYLVGAASSSLDMNGAAGVLVVVTSAASGGSITLEQIQARAIN